MQLKLSIRKVRSPLVLIIRICLHGIYISLLQNKTRFVSASIISDSVLITKWNAPVFDLCLCLNKTMGWIQNRYLMPKSHLINLIFRIMHSIFGNPDHFLWHKALFVVKLSRLKIIINVKTFVHFSPPPHPVRVYDQISEFVFTRCIFP